MNELFVSESWNNYYNNLTVKDYLIYSAKELFNKYIYIMNQVGSYQQKTLNSLVLEFIGSELFNQRTMLIQLLLNGHKQELQYISYLLYDILSNDNQHSSDSDEQKLLYNSLTWNCKKHFKDAMYKTIEYTTNLTNFDNNKIPLEQQICLMKVKDSVKEKAMQKLKEIQAKSEDSASKSRQYLDGLLKIPFGIYKEEYILSKKKEILETFNYLIDPLKEFEITKLKNNSIFEFMELLKDLLSKNAYNYIEILNIVNIIEKNMDSMYLHIVSYFLNHDLNNLKNQKKSLNHVVLTINNNIKNNNYKLEKINATGNITALKKNILDFTNKNIDNKEITKYSINLVASLTNDKIINYLINTEKTIVGINNKNTEIIEYINSFNEILNSSVHGHKNAKKQIERIVGQWINGEKSGYCFGFEGPPGLGKCLSKDTPIMLSTGEIKMVQDITLEDKLMGDDSTPRNVLALGNGIEKMYRIEQIKGDDYTVNESHILSLKMTKAGKKGDKHQTILGMRYFKNDIVDICIKDYLSLPKYLKECLKGYKVGLDFVEKELDLEPYALGYWLGDGSSHRAEITTIEKEVVDYFKEYVEKLGLELKQGNHNLINNKHIPEIYKCNSRENRLKLLAGLIDSDGYFDKEGNSLEITQKNKKLAEDILFLVRSLGFRGTIKECTKSCMYKGEKKSGQYHRIIISGSGREEIPTLLERKRPKEHRQIKDGLNTGIKIIPLEEDKYYGFQIDGNSRFLLGDFTVTHNTSLAKKGLSKCLNDKNGESRPFAFIALGGSSNGSILDGHNYTYVGSTWGKIVDILIENKCMNPIIFIDELDKVSKTEHGKEIIGILTHLVDSTQNDGFQDKYFSNIDLDLSKALFVFSYNDAELIDKILLDRIHRIKFDNLLLDDKIVVVKDFLLPELYTKFGLENIIVIDDENIKFIIETYTNEPGVRKLKEILFEIISTINLDLLKKSNKYNIPIIITKEIVEEILIERQSIRILKINSIPKVGVINGLWANAYGMSGILHIEARFFSTSTFLDLKLTGMQGDVMKESMCVAKTLAISLFETSVLKKKIKEMEDTKRQGIHIHIPEGATPKDGPSAGAAITLVLYSLLTNKKIKNNYAITGEITLQGKITAIGGLELKILGGIKAGVNTFLYPKDNAQEFKIFCEKHKEESKMCEFYEVVHINDAIKHVII
jgi:ATP-dependent Lon protease